MRPIEPVLFRHGRPVSRLDWTGAVDPGVVVAAHEGHFAVHDHFDDGSHLLARDLLGVHKLFFTIDDRTVESSNYLVDLLRAGHPLADVFSVPAGHYVRVQPSAEEYELVRWGPLPFGADEGGPGPGKALQWFADGIRAALQRTFRMLAERFAGRPVYVTLSGGLDSTTIAALAAEHFDGARAVTFALGDPRESGSGSDLHFARRVAADLGLVHVEVRPHAEEVLSLLDEALVYGQDYRDFNVHCALVNAALGRAIAAWHPEGPRPVILSGDTMNELLADYEPVRFEGQDYFTLPRLDPGRMRRYLVGGLDSGDREAGVFARFGIDTVQPYALCARELAALPSSLACGAGSKPRLVRAVMGARIPEYVLARPKVRAQVAVAGEPCGTLALLVDRGIDQEHLKARFAWLLGLDPRSICDLARAGHYRFSTSFPARFAASRRG